MSTTKKTSQETPKAKAAAKAKKPAAKKSASKKPAAAKKATATKAAATKAATKKSATKASKTTARKTVKKTTAPKVAKRAGLSGQERHERIATVAYFRSLELGYRPGGELEDWLWAEQQVDAQ